ncbi:MAG: hypothetical protein ACK5Y6_08355 [Pseudomonadota bacterium]|jgi:hypothetical protein
MSNALYVGGLRMHRGRFYKLIHPVGSIPAGIYRLEDVSAERLTFSVGREREVAFSIKNPKSDLISEVSYSVGRLFVMGGVEFKKIRESQRALGKNSDAVTKWESYCSPPSTLVNSAA